MRFLLRVIIKGLLLFAVIDLLLGLWAPAGLGQVSAYNHLFPGRPRFPFGESPQEAYNFSLFNLDAMFASHEVAVRKPADEFRVLLIGDSSVWGTLLRPSETLAGQLNALHLNAPDGRAMRFYNLGYPTISLTKDLMIMDAARQDAPDLVVWLVTLEAFPRDKQLSVPLVENNPERARSLISDYGLKVDASQLKQPVFWDQTLIGRRKDWADLIRLQLYGIPWSATGVDQVYPTDYPRAQVDLEADPTFHGKETLAPSDLAIENLAVGARMLGKTPLLVVNEPIMVSAGKNSNIRYNFYYPRGAYDQYRQWMQEDAQRGGYAYLDAWNSIPAADFTNSAIHINPQGTGMLARQVAEFIKSLVH